MLCCKTGSVFSKTKHQQWRSAQRYLHLHPRYRDKDSEPYHLQRARRGYPKKASCIRKSLKQNITQDQRPPPKAPAQNFTFCTQLLGRSGFSNDIGSQCSRNCAHGVYLKFARPSSCRLFESPANGMVGYVAKLTVGSWGSDCTTELKCC